MAVTTNSLGKMLEDHYTPQYIKQITNFTPVPFVFPYEVACPRCINPGSDCADCFGTGLDPLPMSELRGRA